MQSKSIYKQFYQKLIIATTLFIVILSFIFYGFIKATIYEEVSNKLLKDAQLIYKLSTTTKSTRDIQLVLSDITIDMVQIDDLDQMVYRKYKVGNDHFIQLLYPFNIKTHQFLQITKNINDAIAMLNKIFGNLLFLGIGGLIMIVLYAFTVSKTLLAPILNLTKKLSKMDENSLTKIDTNKLPEEFIPLANSVNNLTQRIQSYLKYQKELFIGTAHELKTPLAVMKLKSEVTLRKKRDIEKYEETLRIHIEQIDQMNKMVSSILNMGRQEGAQFEKPMEVDIVDFLRIKLEDYQLLANQKHIKMSLETNIEKFITFLQPTLLNQIIQNFVQNAIKFTPENKQIMIKIDANQYYLRVEVIDEGIGCDENIDLFAPFQRKGKESGAGLGLFLAKSAADTIGAKISIENRKDNKQGTISRLELETHPTCKL